MEYNFLSPNCGLKVSELCLGTMTFKEDATSTVCICPVPSAYLPLPYLWTHPSSHLTAMSSGRYPRLFVLQSTLPRNWCATFPAMGNLQHVTNIHYNHFSQNQPAHHLTQFGPIWMYTKLARIIHPIVNLWQDSWVSIESAMKSIVE